MPPKMPEVENQTDVATATTAPALPEIFDNHKLYNIDDAADKLGIHAKTFYKWIRLGMLEKIKLGNATRLHGAELNRFVSVGMESAGKAA